jgi:hypothetical protein
MKVIQCAINAPAAETGGDDRLTVVAVSSLACILQERYGHALDLPAQDISSFPV